MIVAAERTEDCAEKINLLLLSKSFSIEILGLLDYTLDMPVTKTAKRALRVSKRKELVNKKILSRLELAVRTAKRSKSREKILAAISLADQAAKKKAIHKNKAARIKSTLSKLLPKSSKKVSVKRATKKAKKRGKK